MIAIQEYGFSSRECEDFEVVVWKNEPFEFCEELFCISIENHDGMDCLRFESVETLEMAIEALQKAKEFVLRQR